MDTTAGAGTRMRSGVRRLGRAVTGAGLGDAYLQLGRALSGRPRAERDAARIRALVAATDDVRRHLDGSEGGAPGPVGDRVVHAR